MTDERNARSKTRISGESKFEILTQRKLHDMWALILYIICFSVLIFLTYFFAQSNKENNRALFEIESKYFSKKDQTILNSAGHTNIYTKSINEFFIGDILKLTVAPISIFIVMLMFVYIFPTIFFHIVFIIPIIGSMLGAGLSIVYGNSAITTILFIIGAILSSVFYAFVFRRIKFAAKPFKMSIRIMWSCLFLFTVLILLYTFISLGIAYTINTPYTQGFSKRDYSIIMVFCIFIATWTMFLISMISQVAMSAITAQYIIHDLTGSQLISSSLKVVFYSLGSACFAAFMLAIVSLIRQFVENEINHRNSEAGGGNFAMTILLIILHTIISMIEDFLHFLTSWAMTVVALKGCKLTKAMKSVLFDIKTGFLSTIITGKLTGLLIFSVIVGSFIVLIFCSRIYYLKEVIPNSKLDTDLKLLMSGSGFSKYTKIGSTNYIGVLNPVPIFYFIIICICLIGFGMLLQKIMEMIYLIFNENPNIIKKKDFEVYNSMEAELNYKGGYCGC